MAIITGVPGIKVTVCVDNQSLPEYEDDEPQLVVGAAPDEQISKYIECVTDKEFTIDVSVNRPFRFTSPTLLFTLILDGRKIMTRNLEKTKLSRARGLSLAFKGKNVDVGTNTEFKPFAFSKIVTCVDDAMLANVKEDATKIESVGLIRVEVFRGSASERKEMFHDPSVAIGLAAEVHEKALKGQAKSHGVSLGQTKSVRPKSAQPATHYTHHTKIDGRDNPIAIFSFKYRSKESLKQLLVIPRTPSPERNLEPVASNSISLDGLAPDQRKKVEQFMQEMQGSSSSSTSDSKPQIKRERNGHNVAGPSKKARTMKTIDLTGDSDGEDIIALN